LSSPRRRGPKNTGLDDPEAAIVREKRLKKWNRDWKIALIERENPEWRDLANLIV
jgi:putative endonuclease